MSEPIDIAYVEIRPDTRGFGSETKRQIQRELATASATARVGGGTSAAGLAGAGAAGAGIKTVGNDALKTTGSLKGLGRQSNLTTASMVAMGGAAARSGALLAGGVAGGVAAVGLAVGSTISKAVAFEDSFAGVVKTVDGTEQELKALSDTFLEMSTRIPINVNELNAIGAAAGALGIETANIAGFTDTVAKLGVTTDLTSDVAADALARMANITQLPQDQFDKLGSTLVSLGNKTAATESEIVDFALRISGAGHQIGLSQAEILGFGAALASLGLNAEAGGTAISTTFVRIASAVEKGGGKLKEFATVAGVSSEEFAESFRTKPAEAVTQLIAGLGRIRDEGGSVFGTLDQLGLGGIRVRDALLRAAGGGDLLRKSLAQGNTAWKENTALQKEASVRFGTTASQIQIFKNNVAALQVELGQALLPAVNATFKGLSGFVKAIRESEAVADAFRSVLSLFGTVWKAVADAFEGEGDTIKQTMRDIGVIIQRSVIVAVAVLKPLVALFAIGLKASLITAIKTVGLLAAAWRKWSDVVVKVIGFTISAFDKFLGSLTFVTDALSHLPFIGDKFAGVSDSINAAREDLRNFASDLNAIDGSSVTTTVNVRVITQRPTGIPGGGSRPGINLEDIEQPTGGPDVNLGMLDIAQHGIKLPEPKPSGITEKVAEATATRLRENVEIARLNERSLEDDKKALRELAAWARKMSANARLKPETRRAFYIEALQAESELRRIASDEAGLAEQAADDAKAEADRKRQAERDRIRAANEEHESILQTNLRIAQLNEATVKDDETALRALIRWYTRRLAAVGAYTAAGRQYLLARKQAYKDLAQLKEEEKKDREQAYRDRLDETEDRLRDNLTLAELNEKSLSDDEAALRALIAFYRKQSRNQKLTVAERRKYLIELKRTQAQLAKLRQEEEDALTPERSFQEQTFSFLQTQQGFAGRLLSNLLPTGSTAGLLTPGPTPGTSAAATKPTGGSIDQEEVPGLPRTPQQKLTEAQAASDSREGITRGQAQALLDTQRRMLAVLREIQRGVSHPEAANQAITSKANMEIV